MEKEKKTIKCSYAILVIILFAALCFVTDYAIIERKMNKCSCPDCEATSNNEVKEEITINNENSNNDEQVNDNDNVYSKVAIYDDYISINNTKLNVNKCSDFMRFSNVTSFKDIVVFEEWCTGYSNLYVANSKGEILKKITSDDLRGSRFVSYEIKNDSIYIKSDKFTGMDMGDICVPYKNGNNIEAFFTEKINYLSSNSFSDPEFVSSMYLNDYVNNNESIKNECIKDIYR